MTRTLKQQLGMEPLDDAPQHVQVGGNRLTRIVTKGGHEIDSQQPGLPTYHRRIGNPYPLFAIALGGTFLMLGALDLNLRGLQGTNIWLTVALPLSGIGGLTSMMFAFAEGNTFLATAAGSLAGIVGGISLSFIPWTGIQAAYVIAAEGNVQIGALALYKALSIVFFCSFVPVFIIFLASVRTAVPVALSSLLLFLTLLLSGAAYLHYPQVAIQHAAGGVSFVIGILLLISALSVMLAEEGITVIPVMPLPRLD